MAVTETIGPTMERLRKAEPSMIVPPVVDQKVTRRAWRVGSVVKALYESGAINVECLDAFERFERDVAKAGLEASLVAKYGERAGLGGTPLRQMVEIAIERADVREEMRSAAIARLDGALASIGEARQRLVIAMAVTGNHSLADLGRACGCLQGKRQQEIEAKVMLRSALWQIHNYYQSLYAQANPVP